MLNKRINQVETIKNSITLLHANLVEAKQALAEEMCPFKVGDSIYPLVLQNYIIKISEITYVPLSKEGGDSYQVKGHRKGAGSSSFNHKAEIIFQCTDQFWGRVGGDEPVEVLAPLGTADEALKVLKESKDPCVVDTKTYFYEG